MRVRLAVSLLTFGALAAISVAGGLALLRDRGPGDPIAALADRYSYSVLRWEMRHLPGKVLYKAGHLFDGGPSEEEQDRALHRYFALALEIAALQRQPGQAAALAERRMERHRLENRVEDILEGRVTRLLEEQGLTLSPPLFDDADFVFPPVDFEFDSPPRVLAISPRQRIQLDRTFLLSHGIGLEEAARLEAEVDANGVSSLVVNVHGVATYPSVVPELSDYPSLVDTVIHEWLHQYLALHPLGRSFFRNNETRTLNETVANMAGAELAQLLLTRYSLEGSPTVQREDPGFDFARDLRALRLQVERLLAQGEIEEAERLMEAKRQSFQSQGVYIRKINQAYFAFQGSYADTPASLDPIGPKLQALREKAGSVGEFVHIAAQITSAEELNQALARVGAAGLNPSALQEP